MSSQSYTAFFTPGERYWQSSRSTTLLRISDFPLETFIEIKSTKALGRIICGAIMIAPKHFDCEYGYQQ